ncbi:transmembrane protein 53-A-like [Ixodes scapularis]|uniref:transmembrane protein 53-A-like n=1 Tax=Ixodes scapularis TaxID=6945 RepID=UPI0011618FFE|nr:transmembrane protein 53-A-like [Ixodes scapularis]
MESSSRSSSSLTSEDQGSTKRKTINKVNEDDIEYDITFPSPNKQSDTLPTPKEPVVYLLGWAGCKDKHLSKYGSIYEDEGCITIRYIAPVKHLFHRKCDGVLEEHAYTLLSLLEDFKLEDHPLFFHVFSNGGAFVYLLMSRQFRDRVDIMSKIRGVVFDSGPARVGFWQGVHVMASFVSTKMPLRYVVAFFWALTVWLYSTLNWVGGLFLNMRRHASTFDSLLEEQPLCPQLFLYSKKDAVCSHDSIAAFAEARRARGVPVEEVVWEDSPHVQHFVLNRQRYVGSVVDFMKRCLEGKVVLTPTAVKKQL